MSLSFGKQSLLLIFHHRQCFFAKKSGTWIRWKPSWCWISTSTARFDPTTFRLGNQKTVPLVEMFWRKYDVFLVVKSWTRLSLTICPSKTSKYSGFQWGIKASSNGINETHPKRKQPTPRTDIIEKDYIIMHNNYYVFIFWHEMNLEVVQHWPWMLDTWGLPRIWLALWSDLAGTVQVGIHFRMSTRRWKDSLFSGYTFVHTQIQSTYHTYGNNRYLNMSPDLARAPRKQVVQSLARSLSRLRLLTVNFAEGELCWKG